MGYEDSDVQDIEDERKYDDDEDIDRENVEVDDDEEEAYYENPSEIIAEFGQNPLMQRAQNALTKELKATQMNLREILFEKNAELKKAQQARENLGVQLYGLQQQLARIQITLENAHTEYNNIVDIRLAEEEMLKDISKNNSEQAALYETYVKQQKKHATELDSLNETIRQIEKYNEEVKGEIQRTKRETYKTEAEMQLLEKAKENQDLYVDDFNKKLTFLRDQIASHAKQYELQKKDTGEAAQVLADTIHELELIDNEKKQLLVQWKAALSGLSRRDEALAQAMETLRVAENAVHDYDMEIESSRRDQQKEQAAHESLVNLRDRLENEQHWVDESLNKIRIERDQMQERYTLLAKSLAQTDNDAKKLELVAKTLTNEHEAIISNLQVVTQERQGLEEKLDVLKSTKHQVDKAVVNLMKDQSKLLTRIHEGENAIMEVENEIARTKVERLNVQTANDQLKDNKDGVDKEVRDKEAMVGKYQLEIRQRNDEVEKKMYRVDRLNKKYEKMVESAGGEENLGPLENTIRNLNKEIDAVRNDIMESEREWLKRQTEMVTVSAECDTMAEKNNEQQARVTILTQQQLRLNKDLRDLKTNLKVSKNVNADFQKDVSKLNSLISNNHDQETELQAANYIIEMDCVEELKDAERDCVNLQATINSTRTIKQGLMDEIIEMERQALLWEKKIQLDKETRQALDPTVGAAEVDGMEKEIHRMECRYESLKREQERLSIEMETAITKRGTIQTRYAKPSDLMRSSSAKNTSNKENLTQANARKKISQLKKESRILAEETSQYNNMFDAKKAEMLQMTADLEAHTTQYGEAQENCHVLQGEINDLLYQKQLFQERIGYRQKYASKLKNLSDSGGVDISQALQVERRVLSASQALDNVREIIQDLSASFPHLKEVLLRVEAMTDSGLPDLGLAEEMQ